MNKRKILIIDDETNNQEIIEEYLKLGANAYHDVIRCNNDLEGIDALKKFYKNIDVILLDRMMPLMPGVEFLKAWNNDPHLKSIPVIILIASNEQEYLLEGFKLGVYHYLVKPYSPATLNSVVRVAIDFYTKQRELTHEVANSKTLFKYVNQATFRIKTLEDAQLISVSLAQLFPNPDKVVLGISEILINAIEHGNLGISYEEKTELNLQCRWRDEVNKRLLLAENKDKEVIISYVREKNEITINTKDQGAGFDYTKYLSFDPRRSTDNHGRGIAFAHSLSFDTVEYIGKGNEVNCTVKIN